MRLENWGYREGDLMFLGHYIATSEPKTKGLYAKGDDLYVHACIGSKTGHLWLAADRNGSATSFVMEFPSSEEAGKSLEKRAEG